MLHALAKRCLSSSNLIIRLKIFTNEDLIRCSFLPENCCHEWWIRMGRKKTNMNKHLFQLSHCILYPLSKSIPYILNHQVTNLILQYLFFTYTAELRSWQMIVINSMFPMVTNLVSLHSRQLSVNLSSGHPSFFLNSILKPFNCMFLPTKSFITFSISAFLRFKPQRGQVIKRPLPESQPEMARSATALSPEGKCYVSLEIVCLGKWLENIPMPYQRYKSV